MSLIKQNSEEIIKNCKMGAAELGAPSTVPSHAPEASSSWSGQTGRHRSHLVASSRSCSVPLGVRVQPNVRFSIASPVLHRAPRTGRLGPPMTILRGCRLRDRKPPAQAHTAGGHRAGTGAQGWLSTCQSFHSARSLFPHGSRMQACPVSKPPGSFWNQNHPGDHPPGISPSPAHIPESRLHPVRNQRPDPSPTLLAL